MPVDPTPKPAGWTDQQERAYQAILAQEDAAKPMPSTAKLIPPEAPDAVASPDGKWLWDGLNWVSAHHHGLTMGRLIAVIAFVIVILVAVGAVISENNRRDDMGNDLRQLNCQYDAGSC